MEDFRQTWLPLTDGLYRLAFHLLGDAAEAEDAVQDLYVKLWTRRRQLRDIASPRAYALVLMRNLCLDRIRARARRPAPLPEGLPVPDPEPGPDRRAIDRDEMGRLRLEMESLPSRQREVLRLRVLEGLEYGEITRRTGLSTLHLRVLPSNARKTLRKRYGKDGN